MEPPLRLAHQEVKILKTGSARGCAARTAERAATAPPQQNVIELLITLGSSQVAANDALSRAT
jgi:hypothetical protein